MARSRRVPIRPGAVLLVALASGFTASAAWAVAGAAKTSAPAPRPSNASAPHWIVDKAASKLSFHSSYSGMAFDGEFKLWDADIAFDPRNLAASSIRIVVKPGSANTGDGDRDDGLPGSDFFFVGRYPTAVFEAKRIRAAGPGRYVAEGSLTLRGVAKDVALPFTLVIDGAKAKATGQATLDRTAFGVGQGQWSSKETIPFDVLVTVTLSAVRAPDGPAR